jgi:hypothetical protein
MQPTASLQAEPSAPATAAPAAGVAGARTDAAAATALAKDSRPAAQKVEQDRAPPEVSAQTGDKELARADGVPESTTSAGGAAVALERQPPAPAAAPAVGNLAATAGQARREDSPALRAAKPADSRDVSAANALAEKRPAEAYASASQGEKISLEDAKQSLGGWIHLIDGLTPHRVERLEGRQMAGASAEATLIRVVYVETPGNELWLDQQRGMAGAASDTVLLHNTDGGLSLQWAAPPDSWLSLTGHVSEDSLRILAHRVE